MRRSGAALALTLLLVAASTPGASAAWTASASFSMSASAATVGMAESGALASLAFTYDPDEDAYAVAKPVTVTNSGSRPATYRLAASSSAASVPALPAAISIQIGTVASAAACTTAVTPGAAQSGTLAGFTYDSATAGATLAAGASVVLCVKTSISAAAAESLGATSLQLHLQTSLRYAAGAAWTVAGTPVTAAQTVASTLLFFDNPAGRYLISLRDAAGTPQCVYRTNPNTGGRFPARGPACQDWQNQWRLTIGAENQWYIAEAVNSSAQPTDPRWQGGAAGTSITTSAPSASTAQAWVILGRGDGTFSVSNVASGLCAALSSTPAWQDGPVLLTTATCNLADQRQAFTFTQIGTPVPPQPLATTCGAGSLPWYLPLSWPKNVGYEAEADYRILLGGVLFGVQNDGYNPTFGFEWQSSALASYIAANGVGTKTVTVQQSISGSAWTTYATGSIRLYTDGGQPRLACS